MQDSVGSYLILPHFYFSIIKAQTKICRNVFFNDNLRRVNNTKIIRYTTNIVNRKNIYTVLCIHGERLIQ